MISENSKTIREFSLEAKSKAGEKIKVFFGYDVGSVTPGFYLYASIDGKSEGNSKKTLEKIKSLKISTLNKLIDSIGTDNTGAMENYDQKANALLDMYILSNDPKIYKELQLVHRVSEIGGQVALDIFIKDYRKFTSKDVTKKESISFKKRFNNSNRPFFLNLVKDTVSSIRQLCLDGVIVNRELVKVVFEIDAADFNENYYKRDIDLIRKAKKNLYKNVLRKKYLEN